MILESVKNGPLLWPTVEENGVTRQKKYSELSATEAIQAECDVKASNIILQGLPPEVYALVSNHKVAKELWERIQLLMQGTSLTKQERKCKLYDEFNKFAYKNGESLRDFYLRFSLLLNDMNIYNMKLEQFQVNTKFLNTLPPEWNKFVTNVKLVRDLHITNVDQLHAYLGQHEYHANGVRIMHERTSDQLASVANHQMTKLPYQTHQQLPTYSISTISLIIPVFLVWITISFFTGNIGLLFCYNCKGEGHMSKQCTKPKRKRDEAWCKDKKLKAHSMSSPTMPLIKPMIWMLMTLTENSKESNLSSRTIIVEVPKELPKVSMVNSSLKKLKFHLASFDVAVEQHFIEKNKFQDKMKDVLKENERLLEQAISTDIVNIFVNNSFSQQSAPTFDQLFEINDLKAQSQEKDTVIMKLKERIKSLRALKDTLSKLKGKAVVNEAVTLHPIDLEFLKIDVAPLAPKLRNNKTAHYDYLKHTQEETATLREIVENERLLNPLSTCLDYVCKYAKRIQELLIILKQTCPSINDLGVNLLSSTSGSQPQGNTKKDRIQQTQSIAKKNKLEDHPSNHMTGDRSQLINFVHKFLRTVKFGNDHVAKVMGYGDYKIRNVTISKVYFMEGLGHNLFSVRQFCDSDLEVAFRQHTCFIRNLDGVDLLTRSRGNNLYTLSLGDMMASSPICLLSKASKTKSWLWHRCLSHLNFGAINHLARQGLVRGLLRLNLKKIISVLHVQWAKVPVHRIRTDNGTEFVNQTLREYYEQAEAVATACYTQNRSIIRVRHGKTPYDLFHNKLHGLSFLHVFGALCYPTNDCKNLGKLQPKADIGIFIGYAPTKKAFRIYNRRARRIVETIHVDFEELKEINDWDLLFQPLFDELLSAPPSVDSSAPEVIAPIAEVIPPVQAESTSSPSSTIVDQDAPSHSKSQITPETQSPVIPQDVKEDIHDIEVAHMENDPLFSVLIPEVASAQS
uniref:Integrase, catalytic region, zinc finger, CCHC-type, peptidase aspartic, catalytic n=1 Tax=Tanacetum cinerariifolium TaxID=118510 RepID=A0A6L2KHQ9_TANCI|nr:integrase, catalytic region, zinc finger, CCHC-type, peptidase aspartic, catalytic [Tanacetum cinerariifolium]